MSRSTGFLAAASALVGVALVLAFVALGSPQHVRAVVTDAAKVSDIGAIASGIDARYRHAAALPERMDPSEFPVYLTGPAGRYAYRRETGRRYELCATFADAGPPDGADGRAQDARWTHSAGPGCFRFDVDAAGTSALPVPGRARPSG